MCSQPALGKRNAAMAAGCAKDILVSSASPGLLLFESSAGSSLYPVLILSPDGCGYVRVFFAERG